MVTEPELAWLAGLFDVKYSMIQKANSHGHDKVVLSIWDKNFDVVDRAAKMAGSNITPRNPRPAKEWMQRACGEHCDIKHVHRTLAPMHQWKVYGISAVIILYNVMPYMLHALDLGVVSKLDKTITVTKFKGIGSTAARIVCQKYEQLGWKIPPEVQDYMQ